MKVLSRRLTAMLLALCFFMPAAGLAGPKEDYAEAYKIRLAAAACLAAYSDRPGRLACSYLEAEGWELQAFKQKSKAADARFLLLKKPAADGGEPVYMLAAVGTETFKDVRTDLRTDKVYFAGRTPAEFAANASRQDVPEAEPKVHRGFDQYVQAALGATVAGRDGAPVCLAELLVANPDRKVMLAGHSLGGAAATLAGARLLSLGVRPEQIEIITFGAPAVGNRAFALQFGPRLNVTRVVISGDIVTGVLQKLVGGYHQFGRELCWPADGAAGKGPHSVVEYLDAAVKRYYDVREQAVKAGVVPLPQAAPSQRERRLYLAPAKNSLPDELRGEFYYMQQALWDECRHGLPGSIRGDGDPAETAEGCKWRLVSEIGGFKPRNEQNGYYIILQQSLYDTATGALVYTAVFSADTGRLTPLEAFIHAARGARSDLAAWLAKAQMIDS